MSNAPAHAALVDAATFQSIQGMRVACKTQDGDTRSYRLAGLIACGRCGRRFDSHWVNHRAGCRCRHGHTSIRTGTSVMKPSPVGGNASSVVIVSRSHCQRARSCRSKSTSPAAKPATQPRTAGTWQEAMPTPTAAPGHRAQRLPSSVWRTAGVCRPSCPANPNSSFVWS